LSKNLKINNLDNNFTIEEVRNFWNGVINIYESSNEQFEDVHLQRFQEAIKHLDLKPNQKILNIWSRTGLAIPYLRQKCQNIEIHNLEVADKFIEAAKKKYPYEKFQETDLENLPFEDNYFDYIISLETLEHAPSPITFLKELHRTLKPNGLLVMSLPPATAELPLKIYELLFSNHGEGPHKFLSSKKVKKMLSLSNFELIIHKGTLLIPVGPKWLKALGEKIINGLQNTPISELGIRQFYICKKNLNSNKILSSNYEKNLLEYNENLNLKRCTKCILPESFPNIKFDQDGVCNFCRDDQKMKLLGKGRLEKVLDNYRSNSGQPDCLMPFSGGRDSSYGLYYVKNVLKMNPIAYSYDWGMTTDLAYRNQKRICDKLDIKHIVVSSNIKNKKENIRRNVLAWLKKPSLGIIPLFMAGDKQYFYYANKLRKQTKTKLIIYCENPLEKTDFKASFCNIKLKSTQNKQIFTLSLFNKINLAFYYAKQLLFNPSYFNSSLFDSIFGYYSIYMLKHDYLLLYSYIDWNEEKIISTLIDRCNWETALDTESTWRIGDGTAPFYNYIYYTISGFTENDTFRSNQIRRGQISRKEALKLIKKENQPRYQSIKWYFEQIGIDFKKTIKTINSVPKKYG